MFKTSRNFAILERRKYGINVRILEVKDNDNLLSVVGRTNYEPLCRSFKIKTNEDIVKYINYIKSSFELTKINPIDLKNGLADSYYTKWFDNQLYKR